MGIPPAGTMAAVMWKVIQREEGAPVLLAVTINPAAAVAAAAAATAHMAAAMRASADEEALSGPLPMEELAAKRQNRTRRGYCLEVKGRSAGKWYEGNVSSSNNP